VRHENDASFVLLEDATEWAEPRPVRFSAERPRPRSRPYYDVTVGGSDEEGPDGELARAVKRDEGEGEGEDEDEKEKRAGGEGEEGEEDPANDDPANEDLSSGASGASGEGGAPRVRAS
jgi:serine/threonine-protein phosphatase 5